MKTKEDSFAGRIELMALNDTEITSILEVMQEYAAQECTKAEARIDELVEAMEWFVKRCENGEVRSKKTYARFKELIENPTQQ